MCFLLSLRMILARAALNGPLLLLVAVSLWAGNFIVAKAVVGVVPPLAMAFWRWAVAAALLFPMARPYLSRDAATLIRHWRMTLTLSFLGVGCYAGLIYVGLQTTSAITVLLENAILPAVIGVFCFLIYGERVSRGHLWGIVLCVAGAVLIAVKGDLAALARLNFAVGDVLVLLGVVAYSAYVALLRKAPMVHPMSMLVVTFMLGAIMLLPPYLIELAEGAPATWPARGWVAIVYVAVFPSLACYSLFNRAVGLIGANQAGLYLSLIPVVGAAMAVFLLGEPFTSAHAAGGALILVGLWLAQRRRQEAGQGLDR